VSWLFRTIPPAGWGPDDEICIFDHADYSRALVSILWGGDWKAQTRCAVAAIKPHLRPGAEVLDFGCGVGRVAKELVSLGAVVTGVDRSAQMLEHAKRYLDGTPVELLTEIPQRGFDAVIAVEVFQHIPERRLTGILEQIAGVMKPGAPLIVYGNEILDVDASGSGTTSVSDVLARGFTTDTVDFYVDGRPRWLSVCYAASSAR
jgi:2-polyprenyl-3-methyl-5-hydroxy-6-metoxy-1,4-benzoquinol methylase